MLGYETKAISIFLSQFNDKNSNLNSNILNDNGITESCLALMSIRKDKSKVIDTMLSFFQNSDVNEIQFTASFVLGIIGNERPEVINTMFSIVKIGKGELEAISVVENWLKQHQDSKYLGNGIDVLWSLVIDDA